jgi:hypothetical protein
MIRSEALSGDHAVDMRMKLQSLIPAMQYAEETDLRTEMTWIAGDLQQCFGAGTKQQVVDQPFVLQCQWSQFSRKRENHVDIAGRQQFAFPRPEPAQACIALTPWAMPIATRVV